MGVVKHGGGWHAIAYTLKKARETGFIPMFRSMARRNACKTCALGMGGQRGGMKNEQGHFPEFCKKSLQAMASDMQPGIPEELFNQHSIAELHQLSPRQMETLGRLAHPIYKSKDGSHYERISWEDAIAKIGSKLRDTDPQRSFFYASGRSSNEAGFLLQLFCRVYGTNHINNCSYYCHQASGVGLQASLGTGTATIELNDLDHCDLLFIIGANPASNHPRLISVCKDIRKRGGKVVVINPIKETGLVKFAIPSDPSSLLKPSAIASHYIQVKPGGDLALLSGITKILLEKFQGSIQEKFIDRSTENFEAYKATLEQFSLDSLCQHSGVSQDEMTLLAELYSQSKGTVFSWAMGITHHLHGTDTVQAIANLALVRGMVGRKGAGLLPIRGHSNVQGMGSTGVKPEISPHQEEMLKQMGVNVPNHEGYDTMAGMEAAADGNIDLAFCLGGNLYGSNPDLSFAKKALSHIGLTVYLNTTLNTGHAVPNSNEVIILPVSARDEEEQVTTQESMFNYIRYSEGGPQRQNLTRNETSILCDIALAALQGSSRCPQEIDFHKLKDHNEIRQLLARTLPPLAKIAENMQAKQEFHIPGRLLHQDQFPTANGKAKFFIPQLDVYKTQSSEDELTLLTIRSEGQFNTVVYEEEDLYRNQDRRDVILMNPDDMKERGLSKNDRVKVIGPAGVLPAIYARPYDITRGSAAMYYPECNLLIDRRLDPRSKTPAFKGGRIKLEKETRNKLKMS